jgi:hypothetical protein
MKKLKIAIITALLSLCSTAFTEDYDLVKLTTKEGKIYHEVQIIDADKNGLLFRHKGGISKETFPFLTPNIRDMFEPVAQVPQTIEVDLGDDKAHPKKEKVPATAALPEVVLTIAVRRPIYAMDPSICGLHRNSKNWPIHWHRFDDAHLLTNPIYRAAATRNFLLTTGLLPHPGYIVALPGF